MSKTNSEYAWTQPMSELDKETRTLRAMVDALHTRIEAVEKFTRTLDSTLARNIESVEDLERATTARTAPLDEAAIRKDERERWAKWWSDRARADADEADMASKQGRYGTALHLECCSEAYHHVANTMNTKDVP